jgi:hypothetical protein
LNPPRRQTKKTNNLEIQPRSPSSLFVVAINYPSFVIASFLLTKRRQFDIPSSCFCKYLVIKLGSRLDLDLQQQLALTSPRLAADRPTDASLFFFFFRQTALQFVFPYVARTKNFECVTRGKKKKMLNKKRSSARG